MVCDRYGSDLRGATWRTRVKIRIRRIWGIRLKVGSDNSTLTVSDRLWFADVLSCPCDSALLCCHDVQSMPVGIVQRFNSSIMFHVNLCCMTGSEEGTFPDTLRNCSNIGTKGCSNAAMISTCIEFPAILNLQLAGVYRRVCGFRSPSWRPW